MKIFLKPFELDSFDLIFYLSDNAKIGDIYNNGEKRYYRRIVNYNNGIYTKWGVI
jgi:hypothetical protein